jgi:adenylate kinase family enzyme
MSLGHLGPRICIMGPSNSGKSTLATAIGRARGLTPIHLDQLHHQSNTDWQPRPDEEFIALHDEALLGASWVMDGNYSRCLPQRLARATGLILLDISTATSLLRYLRRSWFERDRVGGLEGGKDSVKWSMIYHISITTRENRRRYKEIFEHITLPKVRLSTAREIARFYSSEGLDPKQTFTPDLSNV